MNHWPRQSEVDSFYGNPRGSAGEASEEWIKENIVRVTPPWQIMTAWDFQPMPRGFKVHKKCKDSLDRVFAAIWQSASENQNKINEWGMQLYAGAFNFRIIRGGTRLSMHSWGCAVDFDSARNSFGDTTPNFETIPQVLSAFSDEGWTWGGRWLKPDGMHWQAATV